MKKILELEIPFKKYLVFSMLVSLGVGVFAFLIREKLPPEVPLFYGLPEGEGQLAASATLVLPSLISLFLLFLNSGLSFLAEEEFLKRALIISGLVVTFFSTITTLKIIFLVGSF